MASIFTALIVYFTYALIDSVLSGAVHSAFVRVYESIEDALQPVLHRPRFAFRTPNQYRNDDYGSSVRQLYAFVKGLFVSIRRGRLFGRVRKVARDVRCRPGLLCNVFLWVFVFLLPLLIVAQWVVGLMVYVGLLVRVTEPSEGDPSYYFYDSEAWWMSRDWQ